MLNFRFLLLLILYCLVFACKKKKTEDVVVENPLPTVQPADYRDTFCGKFAGIKIDYTNTWSLPTGPSSYTYTEAAPVNYTVTIAKVASSYSLIYAEEFDLRQQSAQDTISISTAGTYSANASPWGYSSMVNFRYDSLIIYTDYGTGASGNLHNGSKFRCKKISN